MEEILCNIPSGKVGNFQVVDDGIRLLRICHCYLATVTVTHQTPCIMCPEKLLMVRVRVIPPVRPLEHMCTLYVLFDGDL